MFQKIYYLPKSRWTALKDRVINIPVEKENIINTIEYAKDILNLVNEYNKKHSDKNNNYFFRLEIFVLNL